MTTGLTKMVSAVVTGNGRDARMVYMNNTLSNAQRQAASRAKKKSAGYVRLTLRFDSKTAARLRRMAKSNATTQAQIIEVALGLFDNKQLLKDIQAWGVERKAKAARECPAPRCSSGASNSK